MKATEDTVEMPELEKAGFPIHTPEYFNFGYDVVDKWAEKDRNKLAMAELGSGRGDACCGADSAE
ncbi:MAG: hypothetical protein J6C40_10030 [Lentisphaeria bacterium]|nr:hypothetical protein [Lentisphaeria bacterium]